MKNDRRNSTGLEFNGDDILKPDNIMGFASSDINAENNIINLNDSSVINSLNNFGNNVHNLSLLNINLGNTNNNLNQTTQSNVVNNNVGSGNKKLLNLDESFNWNFMN